MQNLYKNSELVLNPDGSLYHINLKSENIGDTVFLVGDPDRVPAVSAFFDKIDFKTQKREIVTHTGIKNGHRVSAISTGMGTDNIDIVLGEIDAAVNIDLEKKERKSTHRAINFIRLGTSGSLQEDIPVGSVLASSHGLGLDGLLHFYENSESFTQNSFIDNFIKESEWNKNFARPYLAEAGENLFRKATDFFTGITATACGFYGPQGRALTLNVAEPLLNEKLTAFSHDGLRITNFEMETSGIYGLSKLMGHQALSVNMIIFNRITGDSLTDYRPNVSKMIEQVMDIYL
jgi:uridine phosphorylase